MQYDVVVVGAGPAGATAARALALHDVSVAILERESLPRYKVCGGGIAFRARSLLDFDMTEVVRNECHVAMLSLANSGLSYSSEREQPIVSMVMRSEFDQLLVNQACVAGAELIEQCTVESAVFSDAGVTLQTSCGDISGGIVIAADGATSTMARLAGWARLKHLGPALECELEVSDIDYQRFDGIVRLDFGMPGNGYAWVFPKGGHLSVGIGRFGTGGRKGDLKKALRVYLGDLQLPLPDEATVKMAVEAFWSAYHRTSGRCIYGACSLS
ncbi:MAG: geranylgeranyl reductase family protein [Mariprofundus sp.]